DGDLPRLAMAPGTTLSRRRRAHLHRVQSHGVSVADRPRTGLAAPRVQPFPRVMLLVEHLDRPMVLRLLGKEDRLTMRVRRACDHADRSDFALLFALADHLREAADP